MGDGDYRDALDAVPDAILASDAGGCVAYANDEALRVLARAREDVVGRSWLDLVPARFRARYARLHARAVRSATAPTTPIDALLEVPSGAERAVEVRARAFRGGLLLTLRDARPAAVRAVAHGRLLRDLEEAVHVRDDFLAIASHELRTPLTPLQLQVQSIQRTLRRGRSITTSELLLRLDSVVRQVTRIERLVDNLLDIARFTSNRIVLSPQNVELGAVVRDVVARHSDELKRAGCEPIVAVEPDVAGRWDRLRLDQIVSNLLSNAIKFGPGHPIEVSVGSAARGSSAANAARIVVRDHGIGIRWEDQRRIFERFERGVPAHHYGGFGLGLWIVRQIAEAMGGTVSVESSLGSGSAFTVEVPLQEAQMSAPAALAS